MKRRAPKILLFLAALPPAVLTGSWIVTALTGTRAAGPGHAAGAVSSILAQNSLVLLVILVLLGSRLSVVERSVGLNRMIRAHKPLAVITIGMLLSHVLLQASRFYALGGSQLVVSSLLTTELWEMTAGRLALVLLILAGLPAFLGIAFRFPFRIWKPIHLLVYGAVPLGLAHALFRGTTMADFPRILVWAALAATFAVAAITRLVVVLRGGRRVIHRVERTVTENHDTVSLVLRPIRRPGRPARRRPGQFSLLRVRKGRGFSEPHPFTISSAPEDDELRFTIKRAGRFTHEIHGLAPGDVVRCEGPYGTFCAHAEDRASLALIAGGVGITPFFSLLRHFAATGRAVPTVLVWANKTRLDIFGRKELEDMTRIMPLRVIHILSRETGLDGLTGEEDKVVFELGHITADLLRRHLRPGQGFYLCGPPAMQAVVLREIGQAFGLKPGKVSREWFFW